MKYGPELQRNEDAAMESAADAWKDLRSTAPVDDSYPEVQYAYEQSLANLIAAMKRNGRFDAGNRYGVKPA